MKNTLNIKRILSVIMTFVLLLSLAVSVFADYPKAENYVADSASVLSENTVRSLRKINENMKKDYGVVVAVCTVKSTGDATTKEYARSVFSEWKMGDGVLLLIVSDSQDYYFVQSTGLQEIITNEQLQLVRNDYLEPDFATGNIDRGVQKSATKLSSLIERGIEKKTADEAKNPDGDGEGTVAGTIIVTILKVILWIVIIGFVLFAALFVLGIFYDPVADFTGKYIFGPLFNRKKKQRYPIPGDYYDERLYGRNSPERPRRPAPERIPERLPERRPREARPAEYRERPRQNPAPRPRQNPQNRMYDEYNNQRQNHADVFYNSDGTVRRSRNAENRPPRQAANDATQMFNIPTQNRRR